MWREVLDEACRLWSADGAALIAAPNALGGVHNSPAFDGVYERFFAEGWHLDNPRAVRGLAAVRAGTDIFTERDVFTLSELDNHPFMTGFLQPLGLRWFAGAVLARTNDAALMLFVDRFADRGPLSPDELGRIRSTLPHLRQAAHLAVCLGFARVGGSIDVFERMGRGVIGLGPDGKVVRVSPIAQRLMADELKISQRVLTAIDPNVNVLLQRLVNETAGAPSNGGGVRHPVLIALSSGRRLIIHHLPVAGSSDDIFYRSRHLLVLSDPDETGLPEHSFLQSTYGLTPTEAKIALGIARGLTTEDLAHAHGMSLGTARLHLKRVLSKTGAARQPELVVKLRSLSFGL